MEIYILDAGLNRRGVVDIYESFYWNPKYNDVGSFELKCHRSYFELLQSDMIVQNTDDDYHNGIIEHIEKVTDDEGVESLLIRGNMLEAYLGKRIALGAYTYESWQPAEIVADLITKNAIEPVDRKINMLEIGILAESGTGTVSYAGENETLLTVTQKLCLDAQLGFRLYADDENKKIKFDIYKGENRTEKDNTTTEIVINAAAEILNGGFDALDGFVQVNGGTNYAGKAVLSATGGIFRKTKIQDRYAEYWETTGLFRRWVYFFRKAGHLYKEVTLNKDHIYYMSVRCKNPTDTIISYGIEDKEGGYTFNAEKSDTFETYSCLYVPEVSGTYKYIVAFGELPDIEGITVETDYCTLIDLTATFGAGLEPELEYCKSNIYYESGWKYKTEIIRFVENKNNPLVLSRDRDTLTEVDYIKNITEECNVLYVKGDGLNTIISSSAGGMRKESFLDLSSEIARERDEIIIPEASYIKMLETTGKSVMRKLVVNEIVDGKIYQLSNIKFGRDFFLGDMVICCDNSIGFETNLRITAATEVYDLSGYQVTVTLGDDIPDIYQKMKLIAKGAGK